MSKLSKKQLTFCREYTVDLNGTRAAIRSGYSKRSAGAMASRLLKKVNIKAEIQLLMDARSKRVDITADNVLQELAKIAFGNIKRVYDKEGSLVPVNKLPDDITATITEVTQSSVSVEGQETVITRKYKIADKRGSLELLGKHLKLFSDKLELEATITHEEALQLLMGKE